MIKKGDPLFLDSQGIIHKYDGEQLICILLLQIWEQALFCMGGDSKIFV